MVEKTLIDAHPSVIVARSGDHFLFSVYDDGYRKLAYRRSANFPGGNPNVDGKTDESPENCLIRELMEEFDPNHSKRKKFVGEVYWASDADIRVVRNALLSKAKPHQDYLVRQTGIIEGGVAPYTAIYSVFETEVDDNIKDTISRNVPARHMTTEGLLRTFTLPELEAHSRGEFSTAHATGPILNKIFGARIPHPAQISAEPIGKVRRRYPDYASDFTYSATNMAKAGEGEL